MSADASNAAAQSARDPRTSLDSCHLVQDAASVVWLSGEDRLAFLERMSTNRLTDLQPGEGRATCLLTDVGRVVDLLHVHAGHQGVAALTSAPAAAARVTAQLQRYLMPRDRVRVTDASDQVRVLRLLGEGARAAAQAGTGMDPSLAEPGAWLEGEREGETTWLLRHPQPGGLEGWDIVAPAGQAAEQQAEALRQAGVAAGDQGLLDAVRVALTVPRWGAEIDERTNPLELELGAIIDNEKGCYIGQEVVARLETYDKVQRHMVQLVTERPVVAGSTVRLSEQATGRAGRITTVAWGTPGTYALAMLPRALSDVAGEGRSLWVHSDPPADVDHPSSEAMTQARGWAHASSATPRPPHA